MNDPGPVSCVDQRSSRPVFISYATANRKQALGVCNALERCGVECWISARDVDPGENYQDAIVRALRNASAMVLLFSAAANNSDEIKKELSLASRDHLPVIAFRIEDVEPRDAFAYELSTRQWIDAFDDWEKAIDALARRLSRADDPSATVQQYQRADAHRVDRRTALVAGGATLALAGGAAWLKLRNEQLPKEARRLIEEGHAALGENNPEQIAAAVARFREAATLAPDRAEPWGALALAYQAQSRTAPEPESQSFESRAQYARKQAFAIDPDNGDALASEIAAIPLFQNWLIFERACRRALERRKDHADLNFQLALCLTQVGRAKDALPFLDTAVASDANLIIAHTYRISTLSNLARFDEAESEIEASIRRWPRHSSIWFTRFYYLANNRRPAEALAMLDDVAGRPIGIPDWNFDSARLQAKALQSRRGPDVDEAMRVSLDLAGRGAGFAENAISFAGSLGRVDDAFAVIESRYFGRGFNVSGLRYSAEQGRFTKGRTRLTAVLFGRETQSVRRDPRFKAVTAKLGLDEYWKRSGSLPDYRLV